MIEDKLPLEFQIDGPGKNNNAQQKEKSSKNSAIVAVSPNEREPTEPNDLFLKVKSQAPPPSKS